MSALAVLTLLVTTASGVERGLGDDTRANEAYGLVHEGRYVGAREAAEAILRADASSFRGHYLLGVVLHRAEANLPLAFYHLGQARERFEARYGANPGDQDPWRWHVEALEELARVAGEMGRHEQKIRFLLDREKAYVPKWPAERAWPLMRLRRYEQARAAATEALRGADEEQKGLARVALCAIEAEQQRREAAYAACHASLAAGREDLESVVLFTNAASAALGMLKMDEAERLLLEGTRRFHSGTVSNPWEDLVWLYLAQGRAGEAVDAAREMVAWRASQPPFLDEQTRASVEKTSAVFLLALGRGEEAARLTARALLRPDRTGFTSAESEQMEAGAALLDRASALLLAERQAEQASWSGWTRFWRPRAEALRLRVRAWSSGRQAAAAITTDRMLVATLRPALGGAMTLPEWMAGDLVRVLGPGVVQAALERARAEETLPGARAHLDALAAEVAWAQGDRRLAVALAEKALDALPRREVLLQARAAAVGGAAAREAGDATSATRLFLRAYQADPGVLRRLGLALPCTIRASGGSVARRAASFLGGSPRFRRGSGFVLEVSGTEDDGEACLVGPAGERLACAGVSARAGEDATAIARRLAAEFHARAFAPRVDLTQADLRSLDGSATAGEDRGRRQIQTVIETLTGKGPS